MHTLEAQQRALLHALLTPGAPLPAQFFGHGNSKIAAEKPHPSSARGLNCYKSNAHAVAERSLTATYPVVTALLSAESMAQLARALWHTHPPQRGDLAHWGDKLASFMASSPQLADLPWLADVARLEWALHQADGAADAVTDLSTLARLAEEDPARLTLRLAPGLQVQRSTFAVVPVVRAHRLPTDHERDTALAQVDAWCPRRTEHACVWRVDHRPPALQTVTEAEAQWLNALQAGQPLLTALERCDLDFSVWLPHAVQQGVVLGVDTCP